LPTFTHVPFSHSNNETNLENGSRIQQDQLNSGTGKYSGISGPQQDPDPGHRTLQYSSYYRSPSSRYPTSYHIGSSSTTFSPLDTQHKYLEEEYDPWTFSKTHGQQVDNHRTIQQHGSEYSLRPSESNRNSAWTSDSHHGTSIDVKSESGGKQWDQIYGPRSQWNSQSTWIGSVPSVGMVKKPYGDDRIFRNENPEGSMTTSGSFPGSYSGTQRIVGSHYGSDSDFYYTENLPVTHSSVDNYPGPRGDWGSSHNSNSQATQRTLERHSGLNKEQGLSHSEDRSLKSYSRSNMNRDFSHHDHISPSSYSESNRNQGFPYNEHRPPDGYLVTNRKQSLPHNEHRPPSGYSGSNKGHTFSHNEHRSPSANSGQNMGQGFNQNENSHRSDGSNIDFSVSLASSASEQAGTHRNSGPSIQRSTGADNHSTHRAVIQNERTHVFHTDSHNHDMVLPNSGMDQKSYPRRVTEVRGQERNANGQHHAIPHDLSSTVQWEERPLSQNHRNNNVNTQPFKEAVSRRHGLEERHSIVQPDPVQLLPVLVQRPRHGDRPSAVPRTATPSKREGSPLSDNECIACFRTSSSTMHYDALCLHILSCFMIVNYILMNMAILVTLEMNVS
jgi:hypothetical protein